MSVVLLDIGNSRCKWGLWSDGQIVDSGALAHEILGDPGRWTFARGAKRAIACNVAGADAAFAAETVLKQVSDAELELVRTSASHAGVTCAYADPSRLGVDRWMAVLAVSRRQPQPAAVVDAGTAMTVDAVAHGREHLGGFIIPGRRLMQRALMRGTADIDVDEPESPTLALGRSTSSAVRNGAVLALAGAVERALGSLADATGVTVSLAQCWFTGGDGALLAEVLGAPAQFDPNVVLEGLAIHAGLRE